MGTSEERARERLAESLISAIEALTRQVARAAHALETKITGGAGYFPEPCKYCGSRLVPFNYSAATDATCPACRMPLKEKTDG